MLSRSQVFLLAFPSLTPGVYYLLSGRHKARVWVLIIASLGFYGYWDLRFLPPPGRYDPARAPMVPAADVSEAERAAWTFAAHALMGDTREIGAAFLSANHGPFVNRANSVPFVAGYPQGGGHKLQSKLL